jgi:hypothetical protein
MCGIQFLLKSKVNNAKNTVCFMVKRAAARMRQPVGIVEEFSIGLMRNVWKGGGNWERL